MSDTLPLYGNLFLSPISVRRRDAVRDVLTRYGFDADHHIAFLEQSNSAQPYHNAQHLYSVALLCEEGGRVEECTFEERRLLFYAALYHDAGHSGDPRVPDGENIAVAVSCAVSELHGEESESLLVEALIRGTQQGISDAPMHPLARILRDADLLQNTVEDAAEWWRLLALETGEEITEESTHAFLVSRGMLTPWGRERLLEFLTAVPQVP